MVRTLTEQRELVWDTSSWTRKGKERIRPDPFQRPGYVVGSGGPSSLVVETSEASHPPPTQVGSERPENRIDTPPHSNENVCDIPAADDLTKTPLPPFTSSVEQPGRPTAPLTTENVEKLNEEEASKRGKTLKPYVRPAATANERLAQARIFLSDEDVFCDREFTERWQAIDHFMRKLSAEKTEVDLKIYHEVKAMLWVHKQRMDKAENPEPPRINFEAHVPPFSLRLPSDHPAAKEEAEIRFRREDHPPFTIERKRDHLDFLRAFRGNNVDGKELRSLESKAYFATLRDPKLVNKKARVETFQTRATQRGSRRAAIQTALRTLARNTEQHHKGDWVNRVITLPHHVAEIPEPVMFMALPENERPASPDPFEYTKKNIRYQSEQRNIEVLKQSGLKRQCQLRLKQLVDLWFMIIKDVADMTPKTSASPFPFTAPFTAQVRSCVAALKAFESELATNTTPSYLLKYAIIQRVAKDHNKTNALDRHPADNHTGPITEADMEVISAFLGSKINIVPEDWWIFHQQPINNRLYRRKEPKSPTKRCAIKFLGSSMKKCIDKIAGEVRTLMWQIQNDSYGEAPKALLNELEAKGDYIHLAEIARPLSSEPLPSDPAKAEEKAVSLIRDKILLENHLDHRPRNLDHAALWSFASDIPAEDKNKAFFHLDRWTGWEQPTEVPFPEPLQGTLSNIDEDTSALAHPFGSDSQSRTYNAVPYASLDPESTAPSYRLPPEEMGLVLIKEDTHPPAPEAGTGALMPPEIASFDHERDGHLLENAPDPLGRRWGGRPAEMPFPETAIAQARINKQIEKDLKRGLAAEPEHDLESEDENEMLDSVQTQLFKLPESAEDLDISTLRKANTNTTKPTKPSSKPSKKRSYTDFASDIIDTIIANEISSPHSTTVPSPDLPSLHSYATPPTPSPTSPQTQSWMEKLMRSPSAKKFKDSHSSSVSVE
ncbi:MAG: hypothetical protein M1812_006095 [Candelaria pacifica]|nr:MAG: hypothetical protein M1812_006095 [Candelaria pacifica]